MMRLSITFALDPFNPHAHGQNRAALNTMLRNLVKVGELYRMPRRPG